MTYTPPPRRIDDITAILDEAKSRTRRSALALSRSPDKLLPPARPRRPRGVLFPARRRRARCRARRAISRRREEGTRRRRPGQSRSREKGSLPGPALRRPARYRRRQGGARSPQDVRLAAPVPNNFHLRIFYLKFNYALLLPAALDVARDVLASCSDPEPAGGTRAATPHAGQNGFRGRTIRRGRNDAARFARDRGDPAPIARRSGGWTRGGETATFFIPISSSRFTEPAPHA